MKTHDLIELASRNLRESALRNALTTLGIAVGVASLVAMLSLGVGLQDLASRRLAQSGLFESVIVYSRREAREFSRTERRAVPADVGEGRALDEAARQQMAKLPNVLEVNPDVRFPTEVRFGERSFFTMVAGLPDSARSSDAFDGMQGRFFSSVAADEAILQIEFAKDVNPLPATLIGQEVVLRYAERQPLDSPAVGRRARAPAAGGDGNGEAAFPGFSVVRREKSLRIVGIIETQPFGGISNFGRGRLFLPLEVAEALHTVQVSNVRDLMRATPTLKTYTALTVRMASPAQVPAAQQAIKKMGFSAFSLLDATRNLRRFFAVLDVFLGIFGSLALGVASLGIVNTLVMAILERRREIGILKALGASDRDVKLLFFAEAGAMGLAGGVLGVVLGWGMGRLINFGTNVYLRQQDLPPENIWSVPWWLVAGALAFSILVSLASGMYPASRAAKLDPVQALRYE